MYKVIIVDDEPVIRKGLLKIINWKKYDCEVCATASDGAEGVALIKQHIPDIIFTDIRMKNMSGLEMIKEIKNTVPHAKIIILTAFNEFDYAQQAIALFVFRFLLKPLYPQNIEEVIEEAVLAISNERLTANHYTSEEKFIFENSIFSNIAENTITSPDIEKSIAKYEITLDSFFVCLIEYDEISANELKSSLIDFFADKSIKINFLSFSKNKTICVMLRNTHNAKYSSGQLCDLITELFTSLSETAFLKVYLSGCGSGYEEITRKANDCLTLLKSGIMLCKNSIISCEDMTLINKYSYVKVRNDVINAISEGDSALLNIHIECFNNLMLFAESQRLFYILCRDTVSLACKINESVNGSDEHNSDTIFELINKSEDRADILYLIKTICLSVSKKVFERNNNTRNIRFDMAISYINEHYMENITRTSVAKSIFISPSYLSYIFKDKLQKSFSDYLLGVRIEESEQLLKDYSIKVSDIAGMVGIDDPQYFSKVFKKKNGITPTEYRKKHS